MDDIGVGIPVLMPIPPGKALGDEKLAHASVTRGEELPFSQREIAKDRNSTLRVV